jgi:GlcNAc-P-P-Und epimerase
MQDFIIPSDVLITGAHGFLGTYFRHAFLEAGWSVTTLGKSTQNEIALDLASEEPVFDHAPFTRVIHTAGLAHKIAQINDAVQKFYDVNIRGTENLLASLSPYADQIRQFVFISSVAVYGIDQGQLITENSELEGRGPYAQSKILAEEQVTRWGQQYGVPILILRLPFVVGANAPGEFGQTLKKMKSPQYKLIGKGEARRSAVLATDIAKHTLHWEYKNGVYNLSDGYHPSFKEWFKYIHRNQAGVNPKTVPDWLARILSGMGDLIPGMPYHTRLYYQLTSTLTYSDEKARLELDWQPNKVLNESLNF